MSHQTDLHLLPHHAWKLLYEGEVAKPELIVHMSGCTDCLRMMVVGLGYRNFGSYLKALGIDSIGVQDASEEWESDSVSLTST